MRMQMQFLMKMGPGIVTLMLATMFTPTEVASQQMQDVVYLKNGSIIRGTIIEQMPGKTIKIRTGDGNIFVYSMDQVHRIAKETITKRTKRKSPGLALAISLIGGLLIDGMGQLYNEEIGKGLGFAAWSLVGQTFIVVGSEDNRNGWDYDDDDHFIVIGAFSRLGSYLSSAINAYRSAKTKNEEDYQRFGRYKPRSHPRIDFGMGRRGRIVVSFRQEF